jgi:hypothetical protein
MKHSTKEKIFQFFIFILENFYTNDLIILKKWAYSIIYPFYIIRNIIQTPILVLLTPILWLYFININKINKILLIINKIDEKI